MQGQVYASIAVGAGGGDDLFDQRDDQIARRGHHCFIAVDQIAQGLSAAAVVFDHAGMHDRIIEAGHFHAGAQIGAFGRKRLRAGAQAFDGNAGNDGIGKALVFAVQLGQPAFAGRTLGDGGAAVFRERLSQLFEIGGDHIRMQHMVCDGIP